MKSPQIAALAIFVFISINLKAQSFEVPKNYDFSTAEDYSKYEKDILEAAKWLKQTPLNQEEEKRKEVSAFLVKWLIGSPTVSVELGGSIADFDKRNEGMLVLYMAGCAKYSLENNYSKDIRAQQKAAFEDMIAVYKAGNGIKKDKKFEQLVKAADENKLDEWIEKNMITSK